MIRVVLESPFGSRVDGTRASPEELARNIEYARRALRDCFDRNEAPFASHLIYPQIFDDADAAERLAGMYAGFEWGYAARLVVVYMDYGITPGMVEGINRYKHKAIPIENRTIGQNP